MDVRQGALPGMSLRLRVPPNAQYGRFVRERVLGYAAARGVPKADALEFVAALSEALANAIEHSLSADTIEVSCWLDEERLVATVVDHGIGFSSEQHVSRPSLPDPLAERGRGLPLMRTFADQVAVRSRPGEGTAVMLSRSLRGRRRVNDSSSAMAG